MSKRQPKVITRETFEKRHRAVLTPEHPLYPHPKDAEIKRVEIIEKGTADVDGEFQSFYTMRVYFKRLP